MSKNSGPGYAQHPEHTVAVAPYRGRVIVKLDGEVLAETHEALELREGTYPPMYYVPRKDVRMERLVPTAHRTQCPFKGEASYFAFKGKDENAVWSYEKPYDEVAALREHLAFYPNQVDAIELLPSA